MKLSREALLAASEAARRRTADARDERRTRGAIIKELPRPLPEAIGGMPWHTASDEHDTARGLRERLAG